VRSVARHATATGYRKSFELLAAPEELPDDWAGCGHGIEGPTSCEVTGFTAFTQAGCHVRDLARAIGIAGREIIGRFSDGGSVTLGRMVLADVAEGQPWRGAEISGKTSVRNDLCRGDEM
jgi:hypothetical protein